VALRTIFAAFLLLALGQTARADERACLEPAATRIWYSPLAPTAGTPLRILVVSESVQDGDVRISIKSRADENLPTSRRGGPPFSFGAELRATVAGTLRVELVKNGQTVACRRVSVAPKGHVTPASRPETPGAWRATQEWNRSTENFFSAWIERMFDAPPEAALGFPSLAPVLHDPARNFLWGYLGLR
jgi:hypothetical protein